MRQNITLDKYKEIFKEYKIPKEVIELFFFNSEKIMIRLYIHFIWILF